MPPKQHCLMSSVPCLGYCYNSTAIVDSLTWLAGRPSQSQSTWVVEWLVAGKTAQGLFAATATDGLLV